MRTAIQIALALAFPVAASAQTCEPGWAEPFTNAPGFNHDVRALAFFNDALYAAGSFSQAGGATVGCIARWTGQNWAAVGADGVSGMAYSMEVLDLGAGPALYLGGTFTAAGGVAANRIARWDGSTWSALGAGTSHYVRAMTTFDDGGGPAMYAVGPFTHAGGVPAPGIARWDGTSWSAVGGGLSGPAVTGNAVYTVKVFDLGGGPALFVGGSFTHAGGVLVNGIATWNGSTWKNVGQGVFGADAFVVNMEMADTGTGPRLHIGGRFSLTPAGESLARVARWNGESWEGVGSALSPSFSDYVNSFAVYDGPSGPVLYAGGLFAGASWLSDVNYVARFVDGEWRTVEGGMDIWTRSLMVREEAGKGVLYASGFFKHVGDAFVQHIARFDGTRWQGIGNGRGLWVHANAIASFGGKVYVGGELYGAGNAAVGGIAAWDGREWSSPGGGVTKPGQYATVHELATFDDGAGPALYATGDFLFAGGGPAPRIARWDGQYWSSLGGNGPSSSGLALASFDDGTGLALYVGGSFSSAGGLPCPGIARWDGVQWSAVGNAVNKSVSIRALEVFDDGAGSALYAARQTDGQAAIQRWDGNHWAVVGAPGPSGSFGAMAVHDDGGGPALFVTGKFSDINGVSAMHVARWRAGLWEALGGMKFTNQGSGLALEVFDDSDGAALYLGGRFQVGSSSYSPRVFRWRSGAWSPFAADDSGNAVTSLHGANLNGARSLFLGGTFKFMSGQPAHGFAEWRACPACYPDCNRDNALTAADFGCFQTRFVAADPWADCNHDAALTVQDFGCFQTSFVAGCP